jgi:hypothetical protein
MLADRRSGGDRLMSAAADARPHGTRTKYVWDGCRCFACRLANGAYENARAAARIARAPWRVRHIRTTAEWYVRNQVTGETDYRGPSQREAYEIRDALNALGRAQSDDEPLWADAGLVREVREHLGALAAAGIGLRQVSKASGISRHRLQEIARGTSSRGDRPRRRRLKYATAQRILVVGAAAPAAGALVCARETWRLIEELLAAGLRRYEIAAALGSTAKAPALQLQKTRVRRTTAAAVRALHDTAYRGSSRLRAVCRCPEWR